MDTTQEDLKFIFNFLKTHLEKNGTKTVSPFSFSTGAVNVITYETQDLKLKQIPDFEIISSSQNSYNFLICLDGGEYGHQNKENIARCVEDIIQERMKKWKD